MTHQHHPLHPATHTRAAAAALTRLGGFAHHRITAARTKPDRGDISITTVIIWVAAVAGALLIAGTIALVIAKYDGQLSGI